MTRPLHPRVTAGMVPRPVLVQRLDAVDDHVRLLTVIAPAGYGKTVALTQWAQWAKESQRRFAGLDLDPTHNHPARLLHDIALALHRTGLLDHVMELARDGTSSIEEGVNHLGSALAGLPTPTVLILDDLHHLRQRAVLDIILNLADHLPEGSHMVLAGRRQPRMRLARLRGEGRCIDFGPVDLAFSEAETKALLGQVGVHVPGEAVRSVVQRTEGWAAGIWLAAQSMRGKSDAASAAKAIRGDNRHIADYLRDEVLDLQSADTARFLMRTSVLKQVSESLCDAVLETTGSAAWLAEIRNLNLFIIPLDDREKWYRYHRMFAEMLRSELQRREPGEAERIHRRAAEWYSTHSHPELAAFHAAAGNHSFAAARLIATHVQCLHAKGRLPLLVTWLGDLNDEALRRYPPSAVAAAWVSGLTGDPARARRALRIAESSAFDGPMPDGSSSLESAVLRARAALVPDGLSAMRRDAERAVALEPPGSPWHTMASLLHGVSLLLTGFVKEAELALESAVCFSGEGQRPGAAFALAQLSLIAADREDWAAAATFVKESQGMVEAGGLQENVTSLLTYAAAAQLALHTGDAQQASENLRRALQLFREPSPNAFPWLGAQAAILLGTILLELGDVPAAAEQAQEANRRLALLGASVALHLRYSKLLSALQRARIRSAAMDDTGLTPAEARILQLLPTHLSLNEIANELIISRNTVKSHIASIYRKLGSVNRTAAVQEAQERGLLKA